MKITMKAQLNLRIPEVKAEVEKIAGDSLKDVVVHDMVPDIIKGSPYLTGNNARSIDYEVRKLMAKMFSTSGYGGYLEIDEIHPAYFRPAIERHKDKIAEEIKKRSK